MKHHLAKVVAGERLSETEAAAAMGVVMDGAATPAQIGALLAALAVRGESEDEIVGFARSMRERAVRIQAPPGTVDTCGTGGDGAGTFNISTLASLVTAACGVPVAKHGNRSASGRCGSADILEALGVPLERSPAVVQRCLDKTGWAFLFAPAFHAATRHAVGPRRDLGVRTAFNLLGPLTNPAHPEAQLVGVARPELTAFMARCLRRLGSRRAWVVHGAGLDELNPAGTTRVTSFRDDDDAGADVSTREIGPSDAGLRSCSVAELQAADREACVALARQVLDGQAGPARDAVVFNTAATLVLAGKAEDLRQGAARAGEVLDSGAVRRLLDKVIVSVTEETEETGS